MKNTVWIVVLVVIAGVFVSVGLLRKGHTTGTRKIGVVPKVKADNRWRHVSLDLLEMVRRVAPVPRLTR